MRTGVFAAPVGELRKPCDRIGKSRVLFESGIQPRLRKVVVALAQRLHAEHGEPTGAFVIE